MRPIRARGSGAANGRLDGRPQKSRVGGWRRPLVFASPLVVVTTNARPASRQDKGRPGNAIGQHARLASARDQRRAGRPACSLAAPFVGTPSDRSRSPKPPGGRPSPQMAPPLRAHHALSVAETEWAPPVCSANGQPPAPPSPQPFNLGAPQIIRPISSPITADCLQWTRRPANE